MFVLQTSAHTVNQFLFHQLYRTATLITSSFSASEGWKNA
jgi:hypothetical protein